MQKTQRAVTALHSVVSACAQAVCRDLACVHDHQQQVLHSAGLTINSRELVYVVNMLRFCLRVLFLSQDRQPPCLSML